MSKTPLIVRAVDVGYGHIKFSDGRDPTDQSIRTDALPSQSPKAKPVLGSGGSVLKQRDTVVIPVGDKLFEVGRDVHLVLQGNQITEVMDDRYALSDAYTARLYGALNYMLPGLPENRIDFLVLGLPMNTYLTHKKALEEKFSGSHIINDQGTEIIIKRCNVYPQPLGSYMISMFDRQDGGHQPKALVIDPGYNTFDWFVCQGMTASSTSNAITRSMGAFIRDVAEDILKTYGYDASPSEMIRGIDVALSTGTPYKMYGKTIDLEKHFAAGKEVINEGVQAVRNAIGAGSDIDVIIVSGGGARFYKDAIAAMFPHHELITLENPAHANARGFHLIGELLARSLSKAIHINNNERPAA